MGLTAALQGSAGPAGRTPWGAASTGQPCGCSPQTDSAYGAGRGLATGSRGSRLIPQPPEEGTRPCAAPGLDARGRLGSQQPTEGRLSHTVPQGCQRSWGACGVHRTVSGQGPASWGQRGAPEEGDRGKVQFGAVSSPGLSVRLFGPCSAELCFNCEALCWLCS